MHKFIRQNLSLSLIYLVLFGVAIGLFWNGLADLSKEIRSYSWQETRGTVFDTQSQRAFKRIRYHYDVQTIRYEGSQSLLIMPFRKLPATGEKTFVFYESTSPKNSSITRGIRADGGILLILSSLLLLLVLALLIRPFRKIYLATAGKEKEGSSQLVALQRVLSSIDKRLDSEIEFHRRASGHWSKFEQVGPLAIKPLRTSYKANFKDEITHLYALLYPHQPFSDISHYFLFTWYSSSIQQFLAEGKTFNLDDWFVPGVQDKQISEVYTHIKHLPPATDYKRTLQLLDSIQLPNDFSWIKQLHYQATWIVLKDQSIEMTGVCDEGYLSLFTLQA